MTQLIRTVYIYLFSLLFNTLCKIRLNLKKEKKKKKKENIGNVRYECVLPHL